MRDIGAGMGLCLLLVVGCTTHHSKQALWTDAYQTPSPDSTFVTEEDSGLLLFGLLTITEPDHYAVLLERARRRYQCARMAHAQLDFYTDHWLIVAFPISRITVICEPAAAVAEPVPTPRPTPAPTPRETGDQSGQSDR
jgi:hypothetical protein